MKLEPSDIWRVFDGNVEDVEGVCCKLAILIVVLLVVIVAPLEVG